MGVLPLDGTPAKLLSGTDLGSDPALVSSKGRAFVINRTSGTIFEVDGCGHGIAQFESQEPGETMPDPWDLAVASDGSLWIARYLLPSALVLDASGSPLGTVDFSSFEAAGASAPNMSSVRILPTTSGEKAFFTLEQLTQVPSGYAADAPAVMGIVDTKTRNVEASVQLAGKNPQALTTQAVDGAGAIYLADAGNWDDITETSAGIERFDTASRSATLLFDKPALGGSPAMVAVSSGCGAAIVADASVENRTSLVVFPLAGGGVASLLGPTPGFDLRGLLWVNGELLVGDAQLTAGLGFPVHTFSVGPACALTQGKDLFVPSLPPLAFAAQPG